MEREFHFQDGDVTVIANRTKKSIEVWTIGQEKVLSDHIDIGIREAFCMPENFYVTWNSHRAACNNIQVDQMVWEGCPNGD